MGGLNNNVCTSLTNRDIVAIIGKVVEQYIVCYERAVPKPIAGLI
jgi:hypothetical protein